MAGAASVAKFNVASTGASGTVKREIQDRMAILPGEAAVLPAWIGYGPAQNLSEGYKIEWTRDEYLPSWITAGEALDNSETDLTVSAQDGKSVQLNTVLRIDNELLLVTGGVGSTTLTVERGFSGSTAAAHDDAAKCHILLPHFLDDDEFVEAPKLRGEILTNYAGQYMIEWSQTAYRTTVRSHLTGQASEMSTEQKKKTVEIQRYLENTLLYSVGQAMTDTAQGAFDGILEMVSSNTDDLLGDPLTAKVINDMIRQIKRNDTSATSFTAVANIDTIRIIQAVWGQFADRQATTETLEYGVKIDRFRTSVGVVDLMECHRMNDGDILILKKSDMKIIPMKTEYGTGWQEFTRTFAMDNSLEEQKAMWAILSFQIGNEKHHGFITGFSTTSTDYDLYV